MVSLRGRPVTVLVALGAALAGGSHGARAGADAAVADLTSEALARFVRSHVDEMRACYNVALRKTPGLSVRVDVTWTIDTAGKAKDFRFGEKPPADADFSACLATTIASWRFPPPAETTDVNFPFIFQTPDPLKLAVARGGAKSPAAATPDPAAAPAKPGWIAARKWLAALGRYDADGIAGLTSFPLRFRTVGMRRTCMMDSRDAAALKKWIDCLRKEKSLIASEIASGADIEYSTLPSPTLETASKGLSGGEWVPAFINGDGVTFQFRLLVTPASGGTQTVKAFVVSASFDER